MHCFHMQMLDNRDHVPESSFVQTIILQLAVPIEQFPDPHPLSPTLSQDPDADFQRINHETPRGCLSEDVQ